MATKIKVQESRKLKNGSVTAPARRAWMKTGLGALGALGLGGVAGCAAPQQPPAQPPEQPESWRAEKVFIFKRPVYGAQGEPAGDEWVVVPGNKVVSSHQMVIWRAFNVPAGEQVTIDLPPGVFEDDQVTQEPPGIFKAKVKSEPPVGYHPYTVKIGKDEAKGGSHPGIIVDK